MSNIATSANTPRPDVSDALRFLKSHAPNGDWHLWGLKPDTGEKIDGRFGPEDEQRLVSTLQNAGSAGFNLYYHVNQTRDGLVSRAKETDIVGCPWLHVDIDPRNGEPLDAERERIRSLLKNPPDRVPAPTIIVDSGNGYQALWKLEQPIASDAAKSRNRWLEDRLGGDSCHNVDRVLRLPGTVNWPDSRKRAKGRVPVLARIVTVGATRAYRPDDFGTLAVGRVSANENAARTLDRPPLPEPIESVDSLTVPDDLKWLIVDGDVGSDFESRSELVFHVVSSLLASGIPDETIVSILCDFRFAISERTFESGNNQRSRENFAWGELERIRAKSPVSLMDRYLSELSELPTANDNQQPVGHHRILIRQGHLPEIVDQAEQALLDTDVPIFQRGEVLVRTAKLDKSVGDDGIRRSQGSTILISVGQAWLQEQMALAADWLSYSSKAKDWIPADPQMKYVSALLGRTGDWRFRRLNGVALAPTMTSGGRVIQKPGFDGPSGLLLDITEGEFPLIPDQPIKDEAEAALAKLEDLLRGFPFVDGEATSVALSAFLTGLVRRNLRAAPLHAFDAPTAGTGKSLLSELVGIVMTGQTPSMMSQGKTSEEDEKRLSAVLMTGDPLIVIDNCERTVEGDFLCTMLTQEIVQARILGKSERLTMPSNTLVISTGNNLEFAGDVTRRVLVSRMDAECERPDQRRFDFDARQEAYEQRGELVAAGLTVLRAYIAVGRPLDRELTPFGSFEDWSRVVREPLVWLERADPVQTRERIMAEDPRKSELVELLTAWEDALCNEPVTLRDIKRLHDEKPGDARYRRLYDVLTGLAGYRFGREDWNARSIGGQLGKYEGRVLGGRCLHKPEGTTASGALWQVIRRD